MIREYGKRNAKACAWAARLRRLATAVPASLAVLMARRSTPSAGSRFIDKGVAYSVYPSASQQ